MSVGSSNLVRLSLCFLLFALCSAAFTATTSSGETSSGDLETNDEAQISATTTEAPSPEVSIITSDIDSWTVPKYIQEHFPYYVSGFDYDGRPIFVFEVGKYDLGAAVAFGGEEMEQNIVRYWEHVIRTIHKTAGQYEEENGLGEFVLIFDFDGFSLARVTSVEGMRLSLKLVRQFAKLYDKLGYGFFLNVNHMTLAFTNSVRPLYGAFLERIEMYGTRREVWLPKILKKIPRDQLPPWYGGSKDFTPVFTFG